jgi:hypothetical protein
MTRKNKKVLERVPSFSAFETWADKLPVGNTYNRKQQKATLDQEP